MKYSELPLVFKKIDRADFILPEYKNEAYEDYPLPIGYGGTISQPSTVAFMLDILEPRVGQKILDIGSGSGWTTALLAYIAGKKGHIYGVEIVPELVSFGRMNLQKYDLPQAEILQSRSERALGLPERAPFDRILVSASANKLPQELINQLSPKGIMVVPIKNSIWKIKKKKDETIEKKEYPGFIFVQLQTLK